MPKCEMHHATEDSLDTSGHRRQTKCKLSRDQRHISLAHTDNARAPWSVSLISGISTGPYGSFHEGRIWKIDENRNGHDWHALGVRYMLDS